MTATAVRHPHLFAAEPDLPGAADLLGRAGAERIARFLALRGLDPVRVEAAQAHYRPGRWLIVCFRTAAVERVSGRPLTPTVVAECRAGEGERLWDLAGDPALPGLAAALDEAVILRRLRPRPASLTVEPLRYRPRRRAVVRYRGDGGLTLFGKVVTPKRGRRLLALADELRHCGLRLAVPIGKLAPGALVLRTLPGASLRDLLVAGRPLPDPERVVQLSADLHERCASAGGLGDTGAVRRHVDAATALGAARLATRLLPEAGCAASRVAEAVLVSAEEAEPVPERVVHGDLYENQILVDGDHLGLLDLDDLGPGDPLLDAANFSAHLLLLGTAGRPSILGYRDELRAAFCRRLDVDPALLAFREAYCLLRLASGPFRVLHPDWPRRMADRLTLAGRALRR